ncbi:MAG: hypothetical protein C0611_07900 [Desulfobacteraceae bacterium]|nr:MAG: hypothetical protein C0611_07900 [Desulfobacteraceae bacterium]
MMQNLIKNTLRLKIMIVFTILVFTSTGFSAGFSVGRILPKGKVTLFHGNQKVGEFRSEAPLPENTLLSVQGECGVKLNHLYLVALDQSLFSITTNNNSRTLFVQKGTVYFALSSTPYTLVFQTPDGVITTNDIMLKASSTNQLLKGYVYVEEGITRVGVLEGGSMIVTLTDDKPQLVAAGHELRLAQADIFKEEGKAEKEKPDETDEPGKTDEAGKAGETAATGGMSTTTKVVLGVIAIAGIGAAAAGGGGGGGGDAVASPAGP